MRIHRELPTALQVRVGVDRLRGFLADRARIVGRKVLFRQVEELEHSPVVHENLALGVGHHEAVEHRLALRAQQSGLQAQILFDPTNVAEEARVLHGHGGAVRDLMGEVHVLRGVVAPRLGRRHERDRTDHPIARAHRKDHHRGHPELPEDPEMLLVLGAIDQRLVAHLLVQLRHAGSDHALHGPRAGVRRRVETLPQAQRPIHLLGVDVLDGQRPHCAVVREQIDDAPVGQLRDAGARNGLQGLLVLERGREQIAGLGQEAQPTGAVLRALERVVLGFVQARALERLGGQLPEGQQERALVVGEQPLIAEAVREPTDRTQLDDERNAGEGLVRRLLGGELRIATVPFLLRLEQDEFPRSYGLGQGKVVRDRERFPLCFHVTVVAGRPDDRQRRPVMVQERERARLGVHRGEAGRHNGVGDLIRRLRAGERGRERLQAPQESRGALRALPKRAFDREL